MSAEQVSCEHSPTDTKCAFKGEEPARASKTLQSRRTKLCSAMAGTNVDAEASSLV